MSAIGILHTALSILPIGFGLFALARDRKIDPANWAGWLYIVTMLLGCISAFGLIPIKGITPAQVLTLVTLALLGLGTFTLRGRRRGPGYLQTLCLSASFLLLLVFTTTEALTRLPAGQPVASGPTDPALLPVRLGLFAAFAFGVTYQLLSLYGTNKRLQPQKFA
jgi:hypothetical protein